jgi:two-component system LytT family sensor kinase
VSVPIRLSPGGHTEILLGRRRGGRRYLSEDLDALDELAGAIVVQVEHVRNQEMQRLVSSAELRLLQAQINPHFLFNAFNALYGSIPRTAAAARRTVLNLADILRYSLQPEKAFLPLSEELRIVEAYLDIESLRLGNRLTKKICVDEGALSVAIPMLSLQPLVENAVKHGIAAGREPGIVSVKAKMLEKSLCVSVEDSANGLHEGATRNPGCGLALDNVRRRLALCYGADCELKTLFSPTGSRVEFEVPLAKSKAGEEDHRGFAPTASA